MIDECLARITGLEMQVAASGRERDGLRSELAELRTLHDIEVGRRQRADSHRDELQNTAEVVARQLVAAHKANDRLKRSLDECGCVEAFGGSGYVNNRALEAQADLFALRAAAKKVQAYFETRAIVTLEGAELAAWTEAQR